MGKRAHCEQGKRGGRYAQEAAGAGLLHRFGHKMTSPPWCSPSGVGGMRFAQGMHEMAGRGALRKGFAPQGAVPLLEAVLNGLQPQWLWERGLDIGGSIRALLDLTFQATEAGRA